MSGFARHRRTGLVIANLTVFEADLIRSLASQLVELLRNERAAPREYEDPLESLLDFEGPTTAPEDPVLARLFPAASAQEEVAAEFRRFTEQSLRDHKSTGAELIIDTLEEAGLPAQVTESEFDLMIDLELEAPDALSWMRTFTDLRLALATRLEIVEGDEDRWEAMDDEDPRKQAHDIYDWLGYLQETLVQAVHPE